MNFGQRLLALGVVFFASTTLALADPVSATVNVSGHDTFSTSSLTFITPFASLGDSGLASNFSGGTVDYYLGTVDPLAPVSTLMVFSVTDTSGNVLTFYTTSNAATPFTDSSTGFQDLTLDETGFYTLNNGPDMSGFFDVTFYGTSSTGATDESFSGSGGFFSDPAIAPEPSSWLLLGTALLLLIGVTLVSRHRDPLRLTA